MLVYYYNMRLSMFQTRTVPSNRALTPAPLGGLRLLDAIALRSFQCFRVGLNHREQVHVEAQLRDC